MSLNIDKKFYGTSERYTFSKIKEVIDMPNLIESQIDSYETFIKTGIKEVFSDFSPITDFGGHLKLEFLDHCLDGEPKYNERECKERDATFDKHLKVKVRLSYLKNGEVSEVVEQEVFMGNFPLMTANGSFIINGAERVIVSQLVRSPGVYCACKTDKTGYDIFSGTVIPNRGAWLEFEEDTNGVLWVKVDRTRKVTATILLRALGFGTDEEITAVFGEHDTLLKTLEKDTSKSNEEALIELYKRLRPGEVPTSESIRNHINSLFYDTKRYDLARVGRYKFNKKLAIAQRINGRTAAEDIFNPLTGELIVKAGDVISTEQAWDIQNCGINTVEIDADGRKFRIIGNKTVNIYKIAPELFEGMDEVRAKDYLRNELGIIEDFVSFDVITAISDTAETLEDKIAAIKERAEILVPKHITLDDIVATVNYILGLHYSIGSVDNIDHLGNRRVRSVGELLQNQFRIGIARLERVIKERMAIQEPKDVTPQSLINIRPVTSAIKEFFGSSQLSQFMDQANPIAELTHKRKLSALGPGGLNRERASFEVRDVHHSHYGRMCPIETPEGQNIGLISSLSTFAKINEYGFIESPYRKVDKATGKVLDEVHYLTADEEDNYIVAQANEPLTPEGTFERERVTCRIKEEITLVDRNKVDYMDVSPRQLVSVATSLIPFLENDDTNRALMGSNMQRQAVPLLKPEAPIIGTGMEYKVAYDSGVMVKTDVDGEVLKSTADYIDIKTDDGDIKRFPLNKFARSNQGTCINQKPLVKKGDKVYKERYENGKFINATVLADGHSTQGGELALGRNILIGFMEWEGYNFEDAILLSEKLVKEDVFTSIHIEEYELEERDTKLGPEEITRDIPNVSPDALKDLDENGIIRIGAEVTADDILVGKVTPKGETELSPEERLLRAIFGEKAREVRDTSLKVPHGEGGVVVDVKVFTKANKDELPPGVNKQVRVYIAQKRKISVGDKMAGRHGNKGVISRILPEEDMPFMADGTPLQIVLNPLGVPSRMNIGQVLEVHLGLVCKALGIKIATPVFDGASEMDIQNLFKENGLPEDGKIQLYDGRTGEPFENRVTVGIMYMLKLNHLVDDKIHARSTGPYSLVTQQPLGGKAQFGGQRFGEMEVWALEAYGAANILQEILTVKSDDIVGRVKTYESIVKGQNISEPGVPESFKVLIKELQSLALDVKVLSEDKEEIGLRYLTDDDKDYGGFGFGNKMLPSEEIDLGSLNEDKDIPEDDDAKGGDDIFKTLFGNDDSEEFKSLFGSSDAGNGGASFEEEEDLSDDDFNFESLFGTNGADDDTDDSDDNE